jgi:hypothetical protein
LPINREEKTTGFLLADGYIIKVPTTKKNEFLPTYFPTPFPGEKGRLRGGILA